MKKILVRTMIIVAILAIGGLAAIPHVILGDLLSTRMDVETVSLADIGAKEKTLVTEDGLKIAAWEVQTPSPKATVIILSGIEKPSVTAFKGYARFLKEHGYASLLIEMRAHGKSEGERVALGMEEYLDVKAGVDFIKETDADMPVVVWGTSMGAASALTSIGTIPEIDGVISCSAYSSWTDVFSDAMVEMGAPEALVAVERPFVDLSALTRRHLPLSLPCSRRESVGR